MKDRNWCVPVPLRSSPSPTPHALPSPLPTQNALKLSSLPVYQPRLWEQLVHAPHIWPFVLAPRSAQLHSSFHTTAKSHAPSDHEFQPFKNKSLKLGVTPDCFSQPTLYLVSTGWLGRSNLELQQLFFFLLSEGEGSYCHCPPFPAVHLLSVDWKEPPVQFGESGGLGAFPFAVFEGCLRPCSM